MRTIDLSCDLGEAATVEDDAVEAQLWTRLTSANVACGGHTGDVSTMQRAIERARTHAVALGAHPSYPDRASFGRQRMSISPGALVDSVAEQIAALAAVARGAGVSVTHVKPHGALYNDAHHDRGVAESIITAVRRFPGVALVGSPSSALLEAGRVAGVPTIAEGFADRRYRPDGSLVPRSEPDALILDTGEAARQAVSLASEGRAATICIHSDTPRPVDRMDAIRGALAAAGFIFRSATAGHE